MKKTIILYALLFINILYSQSTLMIINKDTIYTSSFEKKQKKSLELIGFKETISNFINFNLLKQYALDQGVNNSLSYKIQLTKEGETLKDSLYYPTEIIEPVLKDYYQKILTEKKIQLLIFKGNSLPKNKEEQNKFIKNIITTINNKSLNFEKEIENYSSVLKYKTPLYFDIFSLDKDIVDIIYKTPLNQITEFKTDNSSGLILVSGERKYLGEVALEEIFINDISDKGVSLTQTIYQELLQSKNFIETKNKYSKSIAPDSNENLYTDIQDEILYNYLSTVNEPTIFAPIKTKDGYKIYKYIFRENYNNYASARGKLYKRLKKSSEIDRLNNNLTQELKKESFYKENTSEIERFINTLPKSFEKFQNFKTLNETNLINIGDEYKLSNNQLLEEAKNISAEDFINIKTYVQFVINNWTNKSMIAFYDTHFNETDKIKPEWGNLEEQLLIKYAITIITDVAKKDVDGQKEFLDKNSSTFTWEERIQGTLFYCLNSEVEKKVIEMLKEKRSTDYIYNYFKEKTDSEDNNLLVIDEGKYTRESINLPLNDKLVKPIYSVDYKSRKLVIKIDQIINNERMSLNELQTSYINEYVDYKINNTIDQLRKKAVIKIDPKQQTELEKKYGI